MRSIPEWNFPAFDEARDRWLACGWEVVSPADLDRDIGFNEEVRELPHDFIRGAMKRDLHAIADVCTAIALLPGWESSKGTAVELALARVLGLPVYDAVTMELLPTPSEEQTEIINLFSAMLRSVTADGGRKRAAGLKPLWKVDQSHERAIFSHLAKWKRGERVDADSGAHPLVHLAWRALAIAYQESSVKEAVCV